MCQSASVVLKQPKYVCDTGMYIIDYRTTQTCTPRGDTSRQMAHVRVAAAQRSQCTQADPACTYANPKAHPNNATSKYKSSKGGHHRYYGNGTPHRWSHLMPPAMHVQCSVDETPSQAPVVMSHKPRTTQIHRATSQVTHSADFARDLFAYTQYA